MAPRLWRNVPDIPQASSADNCSQSAESSGCYEWLYRSASLVLSWLLGSSERNVRANHKDDVTSHTSSAVYVLLTNCSDVFVNPLVGLHRPNFGTLLATLLKAADAAKLVRPGRFPGSLVLTIRHELRPPDDSMADRSQSHGVSW